MALNQEQLKKLVLELYIPFMAGRTSIVPPYIKTDAMAHIASIEQRSCDKLFGRSSLPPYMDFLEDMYEDYFESLAPIVFHLKSPVAVIKIIRTIRSSKYRVNPNLIKSLIIQYQLLAEIDLHDLPREQDPKQVIKSMAQLSSIFHVLQIYNYNEVFNDARVRGLFQLYEHTLLALTKSNPKKLALNQWIATYFRSVGILTESFDQPTSPEDFTAFHSKQMQLFKYLLENEKDKLQPPRYAQMYQHVLFLSKYHAKVYKGESYWEEALLNQFKQIWQTVCYDEAESQITKYHQDIFECLQNIRKEVGHNDIAMDFNVHTADLIEADVLIKKWAGVNLERPLCLECNGPWHYPRNSEEPYGKDILKKRLLGRMQYLSIPYFDWAILGDQKAKEAYLKDCIDNALLSNEEDK